MTADTIAERLSENLKHRFRVSGLDMHTADSPTFIPAREIWVGSSWHSDTVVFVSTFTQWSYKKQKLALIGKNTSVGSGPLPAPWGIDPLSPCDPRTYCHPRENAAGPELSEMVECKHES